MEISLANILSELFTTQNNKKQYMPETLKTIIGVIPTTIRTNNSNISKIEEEIRMLEIETMDDGCSVLNDSHYKYCQILQKKNSIIIDNKINEIEQIKTRNDNLNNLLDNAIKLQEKIKQEYQEMVKDKLQPDTYNLVNSYLQPQSNGRTLRSKSKSGGKTRKRKYKYKSNKMTK